jgi:FtsP/CotA-like multicopper oxidase with cupredoxin domain
MAVAHLFTRRGRRTLTVATAVVVLVGVLVAVRLDEPASATSGGSPYDVPHVVDTNPDPAVVETTIVADETSVDIGNGVTANAYTFNGSIPGPQFRLTPGQRVLVHFENRLEDEPTSIHWHGIELSNASDGSPVTQNQVAAGSTHLYDFVAPRPGVYWYHPHHQYSKNQVFKGLYGMIVVEDPNEQQLIDSGVLPTPAQTRSLVLSDITVCKKPGQNDQRTYSSSQPWVGGSTLPQQPGPWPVTLCEAPYDNDGVTQSTTPLNEGDVPNSPHDFRTNEGQTVLTNGKNVGGRGGRPESPGALAAGAATLDVQPGQGLRLRLVNAAATRFFRLHLTNASGADIPIVRVGGEGGVLDKARVEGTKPGGFNFKHPSGTLLIDPGDRADVVIAFPESAAGGVATLWTEDFQRAGGGDGNQGWMNLPTVPVAHFNVTGPAVTPAYTIGDGTPLRVATGNPVEALGPPTAGLLDPATFARPGLAAQNIQLTTSRGPSFDNIPGSHDFTIDYAAQAPPGSARWAKLGDTLELTVENVTPAHHPFHLHGFSFQPLEYFQCRNPFSGQLQPVPNHTFPDPEFIDNLDVPAGCTLRYRVRLDDRPLPDGSPGGGLGRWSFHCHIFFHHHQGMVSELIVVRDADGNQRPYSDAHRGRVTAPNLGDAVSMTGNWSDPEGDAVTLTASEGAVVQGPEPGQWTWTGTADALTKRVYVTATDAGGRKGQAVFAVRVGNVPPSLTAGQASVTVDEGQVAHNSGTVSDDPNGDPFTLTASVGTVVVNGDGTWSWSYQTTDGPEDTRTVRITASDGTDSSTVRFRLVVNNVLTSVAIAEPTSGTAFLAGSAVTVTAVVTDPGADAPMCRFNWDDGTGFGAPLAPSAGGTCSQTRTISSPGTYTVQVNVNSDDTASALASTLVVVYAPTNTAHVTGDGTIGTASFHTNVKYKRGVPSGKTWFDAPDAGFAFETTSYDWLVVTADRAQYRGTAEVNGVPGYRFVLSVADLLPVGLPLPLPVGPHDGLRLRVWDSATGAVVYDNAPSASDDMDTMPLQSITSGDIAVTS